MLRMDRLFNKKSWGFRASDGKILPIYVADRGGKRLHQSTGFCFKIPDHYHASNGCNQLRRDIVDDRPAFCIAVRQRTSWWPKNVQFGQFVNVSIRLSPFLKWILNISIRCWNVYCSICINSVGKLYVVVVGILKFSVPIFNISVEYEILCSCASYCIHCYSGPIWPIPRDDRWNIIYQCNQVWLKHLRNRETSLCKNKLADGHGCINPTRRIVINLDGTNIFRAKVNITFHVHEHFYNSISIIFVYWTYPKSHSAMASA